MSIFTKNLFCYIDFEFNSSNHEVLNLVSCSFQISNKAVKNVWLLNEPGNKKKLSDYFQKLKDKGYIFVAYAAAAECRCFLALGLNPNNYKWVDLYFEHRQLTHTFNKFKYGRYYKDTAIMKRSVPPSFNPKLNIGKDNNKVGYGYKDAVAVHFGEYIDSEYKDQMRSLILECKDVYTDTEKKDIMKYCASDIKWLPKLLENMNRECATATLMSRDKMLKLQILRGDFAPSLAKMESEGFPVEVESIKNLRANFPHVKDLLIEKLNDIYPFYINEKARKSDFNGSYKKKATQFTKFIEEHPDIDQSAWPLTDGALKLKSAGLPYTNGYKADEATLDKYLGIPEIKALKDTNKAISQLEWFQIPKKSKDKDFFQNVGPDSKLRAFLGGFGTQTGRNAPRAKSFILAMSSWLRCLIKPKDGEAIVGIDYASQEFVIAAVLSGDRNMIDAYDSGDPYAAFAQYAGAIPKGVNMKWVKSFWEAPENERAKYEEYSGIRGLFKATCLGLQYGLGATNLAIKLTADCGVFVSEKKAINLIQLHKKTFPKYWRWLDLKEYEYKRTKCLVLKDGWSLLADQENGLSVKNFPVQGTGGTIMRRAVALAHRKGLRVLAPLHDAIYAIYDEKTQADHPEILSKCMQQAVEDVLGKGIVIRQDVDIHDHDHTWVEGKGAKFYEMLKQYLEKMETIEDVEDKLDRTLFKEMV